jgi:hypothetical protein
VKTPLVAAWALKGSDERRRIGESALKPTFPRLPALKLGAAYK